MYDRFERHDTMRNYITKVTFLDSYRFSENENHLNFRNFNVKDIIITTIAHVWHLNENFDSLVSKRDLFEHYKCYENYKESKIKILQC